MTKQINSFKFPGIYKITNIVTKSIYIGQGLIIQSRWYSHDYHLRKGTHGNSYLQRAYDKYGKESFVKTVEVDLRHLSKSTDKCELKRILDIEEVKTLQKYKNQKCYNLMEAGKSGVIASKYTRDLLSKLNKKKWESKTYRKKLSESHKLVHQDSEFSKRRAASISKAKSLPEAKEKVSKRFTDLWGNEIYKQSTTAAIKKGWLNPQLLKAQSSLSSNNWKNPEIRKKRIEGLKKAWIQRKLKN